MPAQIVLRDVFAYGAGSRLESSGTSSQKRNIKYRRSARRARIGRSMRVYDSKKYVNWQTRMAVILRDKGCRYCGLPVAFYTGSSVRGNGSWRAFDAEGQPFHFDHVVPFCRGGSSGPENIVLACSPCNLGKGTVDGSKQ